MVDTVNSIAIAERSVLTESRIDLQLLLQLASAYLIARQA
ncbi:hypothetical protein ACVWZK_008485 [Bradyrhizobium sp. GM0.4]